ncbi:hypothetical protein 3 [Wenling tombus-like virus 4]|uniref:hypothetical protein 3 n=1 Tax=Wenling tombus-like virus 4 TaxID=1923546 RepID=UPI00090B69DC|nr:hypothetical protein 3 [Wenling tombus-like virus 4]APG76580.1 hypothetical protein 3 [Wenling tombus-like virus 4]
MSKNKKPNGSRSAQKKRSQQSQRQASRPRQTGKVTLNQRVTPLQQSNANYRPMNNKVCTLKGSDLLSTVSVVPSPTDVDSMIRKTLAISPSAYPGTRLTQLADMWERYRFRKFHIRYVPSVPNTLSCQMLLYQDTDPQDDPKDIGTTDALLRQATAQTGSQQWNFNSAKSFDLASRADKELYYTGEQKENRRFNLQGIAYLIQVSDALDFNGAPIKDSMTCGSLYVDWEIELQTPQMNPSATTRSAGSVREQHVNVTIDNVDTLTVVARDTGYVAPTRTVIPKGITPDKNTMLTTVHINGQERAANYFRKVGGDGRAIYGLNSGVDTYVEKGDVITFARGAMEAGITVTWTISYGGKLQSGPGYLVAPDPFFWVGTYEVYEGDAPTDLIAQGDGCITVVDLMGSGDGAVIAAVRITDDGPAHLVTTRATGGFDLNGGTPVEFKRGDMVHLWAPPDADPYSGLTFSMTQLVY